MDQSLYIEYFTRWFVKPIEKLKELPKGDGGWVAFMVGLALYERLIIARLKLKRLETTDNSQKAERARDLNISIEQSGIFWDTFRNGLLHQAMPKKGKTEYILRLDFTGQPKFFLENGIHYIGINPWKFTDYVLSEFLKNPQLIELSESYPLATIHP